jgi:hypothetical protein
MNASRRALALLGVATLSACLTFGFTVTTKNSANIQFDTSTVDQVFPFDLSTNSDVVNHLNNLSAIAINSATVTVDSIATDNNVTSITGNLSLLNDGDPQDAGCGAGVFVGSITNFAITTGNSFTVVVDGGSALDTYLSNLLKLPDGGNGPLKGAAVICGTASGGADGGINGDFDLQLNVTYNISYSWP